MPDIAIANPTGRNRYDAIADCTRSISEGLFVLNQLPGATSIEGC
jgi:hypothetical protein